MFTRFDPSWQLSLQRTLAVYRFILDQDVPPRQLRVESFGKYRPRRTNDTMAGRAQNRRVDIILDKRNQGVDEAVAEALGEEAPAEEGYQWQGFEFDTEQAPPPPGLVE
jgi:chemotaxis protein MotB